MNKKLVTIFAIILVIALGGSLMIQIYHNNQIENKVDHPSMLLKQIDYVKLKEVDLDTAYEYGLSDDRKTVNEEYIKLQALYRHLVCDYINQHIDFTNFDQEISQLEVSKYFKLMQKPLKQVDSREDYFSSVSSLDSQYLYLRNHVYVERLSKDEFQTLKEIREGKIENQDELAGFVQQTLVKVLSYYKDSKFSETAVQYRDYGGTVEVDIRQSSILFSIEYRKPSSYDGIPYFSDAQSSKRREELLKYDALVPKYEEMFSQDLGIQVQIENSLYSSIRRT